MEDKVYIYDIGYYTYEESGNWQLVSKKKYTKEELSDVISDVFKIVNDLGGYNLESYEKSKGGKLYKPKDGYQVEQLFPSVIKYLVDFYEFELLEFENDYNIFGWASVEKNDWVHDSKELNLIRKKIIGDIPKDD